MSDTYGAVSVVSTAGGTAIVANLASRRSAIIQNNGTAIVYLGFDSSVTTATGMPILPQGNIELAGKIVSRKTAIYGIAASGTQDVRYLLFDT